MVLQSRADNSMGGLGDDGGGDDSGGDGGSWLDGATGVLNSTGFSSVLSLFGAKTPGKTYASSHPSSSSGTSPWVWVVGGSAAVIGLGLLLKRR